MDLLLAAIGGAVFFGLMLAATHRTYRQTLLSIADAESCERLPDGNFYYIVREDHYNKLLGYERAARAAQKEGEKP